ncbi:hypothetical protein Tco_0008922 [Tanacetum coccineum]
MTTPSITTSNSQMHNDIMAAGSRERSINARNREICLMAVTFLEISKPTTTTTITEEAVPEHNVPETYKNTTPENRAYFDAEAEAIHMILNGIRDDIYSTVNACTTTKEMWIAIERLQQGESLNKQDVKTNLFWEFGKFTSRDGESIKSYYSRFYKMMNEIIRNKFEVATMQYQNEINDIHVEKLARNANPLSLVAATHQGKEISKPITPPSELASEEDEDSDPVQAQRDKDMQNN